MYGSHGRRRRAVAAVAVLACLQILALSLPAWADTLAGPHGPHGPVSPPEGAGAVIRGLVLVTTSIAAGVAMLPPVAGPPGRHGRTLAHAAAVTAAAGQFMVVVAGGAWLVTMALATATLALPTMLSRPRSAAATAVLITIVLAAYGRFSAAQDGTAGVSGAVRGGAAPDTGFQAAVTPGATVHGAGLGLAVVHGLAATVWVGAAVYLATAAPADRRALARRLTPPVLVSAAALAVSGALWAFLDGVRLDRGVWSAFGALLIVKTVAAAGCVVALSVFLRGAGRRRGAARSPAVLLAGAVAAGTALTAVPRPAPPPVPGVPLLGDVTVAGHRLPVLVAPARPGWNLVHIGADQASAGTDPARLTPATAQPGTRYTWARIWLPAGRSPLWIGLRGAVAELPVDTGDDGAGGPDLRGPDGPECAHVALGRAVAGVGAPLRSCPADRLTAADAADLRAMVRFVAARGVRVIGLAGDPSPRGTRAAAEVRAEAGRQRLTVVAPGAARAPLIVVSGWADADRVVRDVGTGRVAALGTYLAPWLLSAPLLGPSAGQLVPLRFHPGDPRGLSYAAALNLRFPGEPATAAGYRGWSGEPGSQAPPRLYAASTLSVPGHAQPGGASGGHDGHGGGRWLPGGTITPITGPLAPGPLDPVSRYPPS
ncbi:hypothetical protein [Streptosporangium sp. NPDC004631]